LRATETMTNGSRLRDNVKTVMQALVRSDCLV
jgi:hypothetical protein